MRGKWSLGEGDKRSKRETEGGDRRKHEGEKGKVDRYKIKRNSERI